MGIACTEQIWLSRHHLPDLLYKGSDQVMRKKRLLVNIKGHLNKPETVLRHSLSAFPRRYRVKFSRHYFYQQNISHLRMLLSQ